MIIEQLSFPEPTAAVADPETSHMAAVVALPNASDNRRRVLAALYAAGTIGLTDFEIETATGIRQTSCGKRRLDLERAGLVQRCMFIDYADMTLVPGRRPSPTGAPSAVWEITDAGRLAHEMWGAS